MPWFLFSPKLWAAAAVVFSWVYAAHLGNKYGSNASRYASVVRELKATNTKLAALKIEDAQIASKERSRSDQADAAFASASPGLKKLVIDTKTADALNALIGE